MRCPECGSTDIDRISDVDYQCNSCGDVFDSSEADND
jgi:ribosomal protein L37AE/L43A